MADGTCLVTGNQLFINQIFDRNLTNDELTQNQQYQTALTAYQQQLSAYIQQQAENRRNRWNNRGRGNGRGRGRGNRQQQNLTTTTGLPTTSIPAPTPPTLPSFCNENVTQRYFFDGCSVQNNKVVVGQVYARNLTTTEIAQLQNYTTQITAYINNFNQMISQTFSNGPNQSQGMMNGFPNGNASNNGTQLPTPPSLCTQIFNLQPPVPFA